MAMEIPKAPPRPTPRARTALRGAGPIPTARPLPTIFAGGAFGAGLGLLAAQQADRVRASRGEDERPATDDANLSDTAPSEEQRASVLDRGRETPTYAFKEPTVEPPIAGGGMMESPEMALERERQEEQRMRRSAEEFAPTPAAETAAFSERGPGVPLTRAPDEPVPSEETETGEETEQEPAPTDVARQRAARSKAGQEAEAERAAQAIETGREQARRQVLDYLKLTNGFLSIKTLAITLFINLFLWNIQGANKYLFKTKLIPDQEEYEDFCCLTCDVALCLGWAWMLSPWFLFAALIAAIAGII